MYLGVALRRGKYRMRRWMLAHMNGLITRTYLTRAEARARAVDQAGSLANRR